MGNSTYGWVFIVFATVGMMALLLCIAILPGFASKIEGIVVIEILWAELMVMAVEHNRNTDAIRYAFNKHFC